MINSEIENKLNQLVNDLKQLSFVQDAPYQIVSSNLIYITPTYKRLPYSFELDVVLSKINGCVGDIKRHTGMEDFDIEWIN